MGVRTPACRPTVNELVLHVPQYINRLSLTVPLLEKAEVSVDCTPSLTGRLALAPGGVLRCSATLELTQDDVDAGLVDGLVFSRGEASDGEIVMAEGNVEQDLDQAAKLSAGETGGDKDVRF